MIAILLGALNAQIAELTGGLASLEWSLLAGSIEGGEALAVAGALLELHQEMEGQCWALKQARAEILHAMGGGVVLEVSP